MEEKNWGSETLKVFSAIAVNGRTGVQSESRNDGCPSEHWKVVGIFTCW